ncbi:Hypothetical protein SRAE_1000081600 [Strongyloides ratti]|uniref:Uncharacterized protein n=1 Tax=Strongyloides ratti TaxID=34506 RepID=A0A090KYN3_STRRB|nr:Hypothetical protein SRAE_1000081600 [Strongyloides ratti]CEF62546.1 Hypothetical protein SRAE_1000081600 [Strongyloides ratti]
MDVLKKSTDEIDNEDNLWESDDPCTLTDIFQTSERNSLLSPSSSYSIKKPLILKLGGFRIFNNNFLIVKNRIFNCDLFFRAIGDKNFLPERRPVQCSFIYKSIGLVFKITNVKKKKPYINMMVQCGIDNDHAYELVKNHRFSYIKIHPGVIVDFKSEGKEVLLRFCKKRFFANIYKTLRNI